MRAASLLPKAMPGASMKRYVNVETARDDDECQSERGDETETDVRGRLINLSICWGQEHTIVG
jgi:hypothetical protein